MGLLWGNCAHSPYSDATYRWKEDSTGCLGYRNIPNFRAILKELSGLRMDSNKIKSILGDPLHVTYYKEDQEIRLEYLVSGSCFSQIKDSCWGLIIMKYNIADTIKSFSISCQ